VFWLPVAAVSAPLSMRTPPPVLPELALLELALLPLAALEAAVVELPLAFADEVASVAPFFADAVAF
jgi:hypothetical protein